MAIMRKKQIKELSNDNIVKRLTELRLELAKEKAQIAVGGSPSSTGKIREMRRTVAKLLTEQKKRRGGSKAGRDM